MWQAVRYWGSVYSLREPIAEFCKQARCIDLVSEIAGHPQRLVIRRKSADIFGDIRSETQDVICLPFSCCWINLIGEQAQCDVPGQMMAPHQSPQQRVASCMQCILY